MSLKQLSSRSRDPSTFESRVVLDESQTVTVRVISSRSFESRVVLDESQTYIDAERITELFESRVVLDESQTSKTGLKYGYYV